MSRTRTLMLTTVLATGAIARAQPAPDAPPATGGDAEPVPAPATPPVQPVAPKPADQPTDPYAPAPRIEHEHKPVDLPVVLTTPSGWLLPAGVLYSRTAVDTGGGVSSDNRVGLGDVAEFGVTTTDQVRERDTADAKASQIQPYVLATFRLGIAEGRLGDYFPGLTLGFEKSFERNHHDFKTRVAELTLVASKHVGSKVALHLGGGLWDASLQSNATVAPGDAPPPEYSLHGLGDRAKQLRVFGGIETRPLPESEILIDLGWAPEFCYQCADADKIKLRPELSWGVRYEVASFMHIESGVRVPDIGNFNLLDAQIFGELTFTSFALRHGIDSLKQ